MGTFLHPNVLYSPKSNLSYLLMSPNGPSFFQYASLIPQNTLPHEHNLGITFLFMMQLLEDSIFSNTWDAVLQEELWKQYVNILFSGRMEDVGISV